jgi:hypothetical protein
VSDDLEIYAAIAAGLAGGLDRAELLRAHGLDELAYEALEARAEATLDAATSLDRGVPEAIARFDRALRSAGAKDTREIPSLEEFARALMIAEEGGKVHERLAEKGFSVERLLRASAHYTPRLAHEPELARRFKALCRRGGGDKPEG